MSSGAALSPLTGPMSDKWKPGRLPFAAGICRTQAAAGEWNADPIFSSISGRPWAVLHSTIDLHLCTLRLRLLDASVTSKNDESPFTAYPAPESRHPSPSTHTHTRGMFAFVVPWLRHVYLPMRCTEHGYGTLHLKDLGTALGSDEARWLRLSAWQ